MLSRVLLAIAFAVAFVLLAGVGAGALIWNRGTGAVEAAILEQAAAPVLDETTSPPAPVRRYLDLAVPGSAAPIRVAQLEQAGEFLLSPPDGWVPFTATQLFTANPPAMLWDASMRMAPLLRVRVRDSYRDGVGSMHGAVLGLFTVLRESGPDRMAEASLVRYLAESPWLPTRLHPSPGLRWTPVDDSTATVALTDGSVTVSLEFRFAPNGEIREVYADRRFRGEAEDPQWAPWIGRFTEYEERSGYRIPTRGEVAWIIDGREQPYWRGRIGSVRYETAKGSVDDVTTAR